MVQRSSNAHARMAPDFPGGPSRPAGCSWVAGRNDYRVRHLGVFTSPSQRPPVLTPGSRIASVPGTSGNMRLGAPASRAKPKPTSGCGCCGPLWPQSAHLLGST